MLEAMTSRQTNTELEDGGSAVEKRRLHRFLLRWLLGIVLFVALLPTAARYVLDAHVIPRLTRRQDALRIHLSMPSLDYTGLTAILTAGGRAHAPAFETGAIRVRYTPASLMRRTLEEVSIHGAVLYLERTEDGWRPRGIPPRPSASVRGNGPLPELSIGRVRIPGAHIVFLEQDRRTQHTCDIEALDVQLAPGGGTLRLKLSTVIEGFPVELGYHAQLDARGVQMRGDPDFEPRIRPFRAFWPDAPLDVELREHALGLDWGPDGEMVFIANHSMDVTWAPCDTNVEVRARVRTSVEVDTSPGAFAATIIVDTEGTAGKNLPFQLGNVRLTMPLEWPVPEDGYEGRLVVDKATYGDLILGPLDLACRVDEEGLSVSGSCAAGKRGTATARIEGCAIRSSTGMRISCRADLPLGSNAAGLELRELLRTAPKGGIEGKLSATVTTHTGSNAVLGVEVDARRLHLPEKSLSISGLRTACRFDLADAPASERHQRLTAEEIRLGSLTLRQAEAQYDIESDGSVFLESARAECSGGRVEVLGLRITPGSEVLEVVLRGDRLQIKDLFTQLGLPTASGDGALSGRIPLRLERGRPRFKEGFLFTAPGRPGVISFGDTDALAGALAQGAGQNAQVALVGAALKAFAYEWITVSINSEKDVLRLLMTISGRPARNIPFKLENKTGTYVVTSPGESGSRPPMVVNLNFRIPLDEIMKYSVDWGN